MSSPVHIRRAEPADSPPIAALHCLQIPWGLLSDLGEAFVATFYRTLIGSAVGFGFLAERDGRIVGFASGVVNWRRFYGEFLRRHPALALRMVARSLPGRRWRRLLETTRYAASAALPPAELVSIALVPAVRGAGVGDQLVRRVIEEFAGRRVRAIRVTAGWTNLAARRLYERMGFEIHSRAEVHRGEHAAVYVMRLDGSRS